MVNPVAIPESVWEGQLPFTPPLPPFSPGLAFAFGHGQTAAGPSVVASVRFNMPQSVVDRYRGQPLPAIALLAADVATGEVFVQGCVGQDRRPATFDPQVPLTSATAGLLIGGTVNMDLVAHLGLPPHAARYLVCAWIDEWASQPRFFDLPAAATRQRSGIQPPLQQADGVQPPGAAPAGAPLRMAAGGAGKLSARWELPQPSAVSLVAYELGARRYRSLVLADAKSPRAGGGQSEVDVRASLGIDPANARAFLLVGGGGVSAMVFRAG